MLYFPQTRIQLSAERHVATGQTVTAEGQALVFNTTAGGVQPSAGVANEQFSGIAIAQQLTPLAVPEYESLVPNASNQITLKHTPLTGTLFVYDTTTSTVQTAGTPSTVVNNYSIATNVITVNVAQGTDTMRIGYRYSPTTLEATILLQGNIPAGGSASLQLNSVGVIQTGDVFTSEFDTSINWATATSVTLGANGLFTVGGTGVTVPAVIISVPSVTLAYLGLAIRG